MILLKIFLLPISVSYGLVTWARNILYRVGIFDEHIIPVPSVCIGNLTVGGTGKTPMTELLVKKLHSDYSVVMLSRGYGRASRGIYEATPSSRPEDIGDEPFQVYKKFGHLIKVFVGENRWKATQEILQKYPKTNMLLLDDAYQHRAVKAKLNILLSDFYRPLYTDWLLPTGLLRESRWGAKRAHVVVITKCPPFLSVHSKTTIRKDIRKYLKSSAPIFFSSLQYANPVGSNTAQLFDPTMPLFVFSGIANDRPLLEYVKSNFKLAGKISFNDHHTYRNSDIAYIVKQSEKLNGCKILLTTEKDHVKLQTPEFRELLKNHHLYYLPIEISLSNQEKEFDQFLLDTLNA